MGLMLNAPRIRALRILEMAMAFSLTQSDESTPLMLKLMRTAGASDRDCMKAQLESIRQKGSQRLSGNLGGLR